MNVVHELKIKCCHFKIDFSANVAFETQLYLQSLSSPMTGEMATDNKIRPVQVKVKREPTEINEVSRSDNAATGR